MHSWLFVYLAWEELAITLTVRGHMSKHDILTEDEMKRFKIQPFFTREIQRYAERSGLKPPEIRILDWGCG